MKIELITPEEHSKLLVIYHSAPNLFLQNKGYEGISKDKLTDFEKEKIKDIEEILSKSIAGFYNFQNFRLSNNSKEIEIRFQYNYNYDRNINSFKGVGYILLDELLNGFREKK